jgi:hypothetical protein
MVIPEDLCGEILSELVDAMEAFKVQTYLNCDLRYYNLDFIVEKYGYFDVIAIDPPWRIRGGQKNSDSPYMFTNNKFQLEYDTLSNESILEIPIEKLSRKGF